MCRLNASRLLGDKSGVGGVVEGNGVANNVGVGVVANGVVANGVVVDVGECIGAGERGAEGVRVR